MGRLNYTLLDRYMLTATVRRDGSSRFKDHWSTFPAVALAWKINEEAFMKNLKVVSDMKLRLGWGKTGQQDVNNDYAWIPTYSMSTGTNGFYPVTGDGTLYRPNNYTPDLKWETTTTYNIGLDLGFFNQRLTASIDLYYRKTTDLLNYAPTEGYVGIPQPGLAEHRLTEEHRVSRPASAGSPFRPRTGSGRLTTTSLIIRMRLPT